MHRSQEGAVRMYPEGRMYPDGGGMHPEGRCTGTEGRSSSTAVATTSHSEDRGTRPRRGRK